MTAAKTRVLLADDHSVLREGLRELLQKEPDIHVVGEAADGGEAIRMAHELVPDVIVMDIGMPGMNGVEATRRIVSELPETRVLCLSVHRENSLVQGILRAGASGYLFKTSAGKELIGAVRTVAAGQTYLSPPVALQVVERHIRGSGAEASSPPRQLTPREREVLQLIAEGHHTKRIAEKLGISPKTVLNHRENMMKKVGTRSLANLIRYAIHEGLTEL